MRTDKTEWLYKCVVTAAMIETIVVPLFGFIVGSDYHKPSLVAAPAFTEQPRIATDDPRRSHITAGGLPALPCEIPVLATAMVQEIGSTSANCSKSSSRHWSRAHVRGQRDISMNNAILSVSGALIGSTVGGLAPVLSNYLQRGQTRHDLLNRQLKLRESLYSDFIKDQRSIASFC